MTGIMNNQMMAQLMPVNQSLNILSSANMGANAAMGTSMGGMVNNPALLGSNASMTGINTQGLMQNQSGLGLGNSLMMTTPSDMINATLNPLGQSNLLQASQIPSTPMFNPVNTSSSMLGSSIGTSNGLMMPTSTMMASSVPMSGMSNNMSMMGGMGSSGGISPQQLVQSMVLMMGQMMGAMSQLLGGGSANPLSSPSLQSASLSPTSPSSMISSLPLGASVSALGGSTATPAGSAMSSGNLMTGFEGEKFSIQAQDGQIYNLLSDRNIQLNAQFGKPAGSAATTVTEAGVKVGVSEIRLNVGEAAPILGRNPMQIGQTVSLDQGGTAVWDGAKLTVKTKEYTVVLSKQNGQVDSSVSINPGANVIADGIAPHGLIGQTADGNGATRGGGIIDTVSATGQIGTSQPGDVASLNNYLVKNIFGLMGAPFNRFGTLPK